MAIQDINAYAHLSDEDIRDIGARLAAIENEHRDALGAGDADYIKSLIRAQRTLDLIARIATASSSTVTVPAGMMLAMAKILENLEIGHNVMHGQWDWMNDPEIHSSTWEWDNTGP
ncbi:MAG: acyl-CoA desaturase, partial [Corynebacterium sp.]|nr:acyl-CoA desaturase [Corynebacterium sp.]